MDQKYANFRSFFGAKKRNGMVFGLRRCKGYKDIKNAELHDIGMWGMVECTGCRDGMDTEMRTLRWLLQDWGGPISGQLTNWPGAVDNSSRGLRRLFIDDARIEF